MSRGKNSFSFYQYDAISLTPMIIRKVGQPQPILNQKILDFPTDSFNLRTQFTSLVGGDRSGYN